ncbi:SUA5/yciO/yrdC domain protein [Rippkaea orientalis PCC 8801]|uniref:L-threonylcarbamoyladenylate synthase n=1 Tax=Rippkaea orientalis (strain PCC 8801 / RF-1) TaxID=41431 RepID=B7K4X8_RIPO1|nr:L-threonylcarbamoyladenylate synthase [Rippkaea orientalis]ACK66634.1 SUA5/yciO/yrdC domain protein [Rippkaea orientalis PCC 8801]
MPKVTQTELIEAAKMGQVVSFPTDTVPALAALPQNAALIFATKKRPPDKPLILMGASIEALWQYIQGTPEELALWQQIAESYWPGSLTLVLPASSLVPAAMNPLDPTTIGVRIPNHPIAQAILAETGCLATTSANRSGQPPLETMTAIAANFPDVRILDDINLNDKDKFGSGQPSTVAKWTGKAWEILRQGSVFLQS